MRVLIECKRALAYANLCNENGITMAGKRISNGIVNFFIVFPITFAGFLAFLVCVKNYEYGLKSISSPIYIVLGCFSIAAIYICLTLKNNLIIELIASLQKIVKRSMISYINSNKKYHFFVMQSEIQFKDQKHLLNSWQFTTNRMSKMKN